MCMLTTEQGGPTRRSQGVESLGEGRDSPRFQGPVSAPSSTCLVETPCPPNHHHLVLHPKVQQSGRDFLPFPSPSSRESTKPITVVLPGEHFIRRRGGTEEG